MQRIDASRSSRTLLAKSASDFTILVFTDSFCNSRFHLASGPFRCSSPPPDFWTGTGQPHGRHLSRVYWFRTSALLVSSIRSRFLTRTPVLSPPPPAARRSPRPRRFSMAVIVPVASSVPPCARPVDLRRSWPPSGGLPLPPRSIRCSLLLQLPPPSWYVAAPRIFPSLREGFFCSGLL